MPKEGHAASFTKHDRLPRLNQHSGKKELRSQVLERLLYKIKFPHRYAAGKQQHVRLQPFLYQLRQFALFVWSNWQLHRLASAPCNHRRKRVAVAVADLAGAWLLHHVHQFIARRKNGYPGLAADVHSGFARSSSKSNLRRSHPCSPWQQLLSRLGLRAGRDDVVADAGVSLDLNQIIRSFVFRAASLGARNIQNMVVVDRIFSTFSLHSFASVAVNLWKGLPFRMLYH